MSRIIDLSMPIEDHFRWPVERRVRGDHERGDAFQATWLGWTVHGFTHTTWTARATAASWFQQAIDTPRSQPANPWSCAPRPVSPASGAIKANDTFDRKDARPLLDELV